MENQSKYIQVDEALARLRGNKSLYGKMLKMFLASPEFQSLEDAIASGDNEKAADVAHAIKGITGNLSLTALFEKSTDLLGELRGGSYNEETLASYRTLLQETRAQVEDLLASFEA